MQYMGGKQRIAKPIANIILASRGARSIYVEPFLGAGSIAVKVAPSFEHSILSDAHVDLVMMWQAVQNGWEPPTYLSEDEYLGLRNSEPSALRGFAGFPCSFGGKWFGGYARDPGSDRNYARTASKSIMKRADILRDSMIYASDYRDALLSVDLSNAVVYADPPYRGTTNYGGLDNFDSEDFWHVMDECVDNGALVFVSEYSAPANWVSVWQATPTVSLQRQNLDQNGAFRRATENLFSSLNSIHEVETENK